MELEKFESNHCLSLFGSMVGSKVNCFEHGLHGTINVSLVITQSQFLASSLHVMYYIGVFFLSGINCMWLVCKINSIHLVLCMV